MGAAGPGEILTSGTVRDLVVGSSTVLEDRGTQPLKGVEGTWRLFSLAGLCPGVRGLLSGPAWGTPGHDQRTARAPAVRLGHPGPAIYLGKRWGPTAPSGLGFS
jgi:hypothetical protein